MECHGRDRLPWSAVAVGLNSRVWTCAPGHDCRKSASWGFIWKTGCCVRWRPQCNAVADAPCELFSFCCKLHDEPRVGSLVGHAVVCEVALLFHPTDGDRRRALMSWLRASHRIFGSVSGSMEVCLAPGSGAWRAERRCQGHDISYGEVRERQTSRRQISSVTALCPSRCCLSASVRSRWRLLRFGIMSGGRRPCCDARKNMSLMPVVMQRQVWHFGWCGGRR